MCSMRKFLTAALALALLLTLLPLPAAARTEPAFGTLWAHFSALEEHTWLLTVMSAVVIGAMIVALVKKVFTHPLGLIPAVLVIAGGIGNLIDRALFGFVTDMFHTLFMNFAVFNVADIAITVGGFWLVAYVAFFYDKLEVKEAPADDDPADLPADGQ